MRLPFWLRRPFLVLKGLLANRVRPNLAGLSSIEDPEAFIWAVLPHAARSFAASILLLPEPAARVTAVAYLYARMLDTYEDLSPSHEAARDSLRVFASRFSSEPMLLAPPSPQPAAVDLRDRTHLLLVERHHLVDRVYADLPALDRMRIAELIRQMSEGMIEFSEAFERQGGVLDQPDQVIGYCHRVIGNPALFVMETMSADMTPDHRRHALQVSEFIQLANITRDIEKDLESGVAYHTALRPHLGSNGLGSAKAAVEEARRDLMLLAAARAPSFRHLLNRHRLPSLSPARSAAVLMMLFTGRHYGRMALSDGVREWSGPNSLTAMLITSIPASWSSRWADRTLRRIETALLGLS